MNINSFIDHQDYVGPSHFTKSHPFTGQPLHTVSSCDLMGLVQAIQSSNKAFQEFKSSTREERIKLVSALLTQLEAHHVEYARFEALDQALPLTVVRNFSIGAAVENIRQLITAPAPIESTDLTAPTGVIALIASWNLSLRVILDRLVPALLAGNSVIVKVSSESPVTAYALSELIQSANLPKGLVNVLVSADPDVKKMLMTHPGVKAVSLVGRIETATACVQAVAQNNLQNFKKLQISTGSKNSAVALGDVTDELFQKVISSFLIGQGQLAWNSARLFVLEKNETEWQQRITQYLADLRPSESIEDSSPWTPCLKKSSFEKYGEIQKMALDDQAKLIKAGYGLNASQSERYLPPIFTKDMSRCSTLQQDQIHSPCFILSAVKYPFDVPKYSNVSYFGFAAHLWGDPAKLTKVAQALEVGLIHYNRC
ncbi:MAG: aldehyde dehydrogenase family protein, partial [Bdellovibrionaceae bacterium]|nr:aldehyde dehydrogenase family protein [Pseudobdellovibrionaceae bacterium]